MRSSCSARNVLNKSKFQYWDFDHVPIKSPFWALDSETKNKTGAWESQTPTMVQSADHNSRSQALLHRYYALWLSGAPEWEAYGDRIHPHRCHPRRLPSRLRHRALLDPGPAQAFLFPVVHVTVHAS